MIIDAHSRAIIGALNQTPQAQPALARLCKAYHDAGMSDSLVDADLTTLIHWVTIVDATVTDQYVHDIGESAGCEVTKRQNRDNYIQSLLDTARRAQDTLRRAQRILGTNA